MNVTNRNRLAFGAGMLWATLAGGPAWAEDIELFIGSANSSNQARPNILFILDDSGSMAISDVIAQNNYNPNAVPAYAGSCSATRVYWTTGTTPPPCNTTQYFDRSVLHCKKALDAFGVANGGVYTDEMAAYDRN